MANTGKPKKTTRTTAAKKPVRKKAITKPRAKRDLPNAAINTDARRLQAYKYYVEFDIEQKEIARIVKVSPNTITTWKKEDNWDADKEDMQLAPERIMRRVIKQYDALLNQIDQREPPNNVANSKEADTLNKLADSVNKLRNEIGKGHKTEVGKLFIRYIMQTYGKEKAIEMLDFWHEFIMQTS